MKKNLLIVTLQIFFTSCIYSQFCSTGDLNFYRQSQIDSFPVNYSGCKTISGGIYINGDDIKNLNGFKQLNSIEGYLYIVINPALTSLHGLDSLKIIHGELNITSNSRLKDFTGLESLNYVGQKVYVLNNGIKNCIGLKGLKFIGGGLYIFNNPNLIDLEGFSKLTVIGEIQIDDNLSLKSLAGFDSLNSTSDFFISGNKALTTLDGLENLQSTGYFQIDNTSLKDFSKLKNLTSVNGGIIIAQNPYLKSLNGLEKLNYISGYGFDIEDNPSLQDIASISHLNSIGNGIIFINNNDSLKTLKGLENIDTASISDLVIQNSNSLYGCAVKSICNYLTNNGHAIISGNTTGCNSVKEVDAACLVLPIQLLNFSAIQKAEVINLSWQTANEISNNYFSIERSTDSKAFSSIGIKQGLNNIGTNNYSFTDNAPLKGINYYRPKQVDKDGKFSYSGIVSVDFMDGAVFAIAPNPATNNVNVMIPANNSVSEILIYDITGKKVIGETVEANVTSKQINISGLASGVYNVVLVQDGKKEMMKLVKK